MPTGALGVSWVKYYCRYHKEGRQLFMAPCEQKNTTKQVKEAATTAAYLNSHLICLFYFSLCWSGCSHTPGPHASHAQVLRPPEVGLHRQALLLRRGDQREVGEARGARRGGSRALWDKRVHRWLTRTTCEGEMDRSPNNPAATVAPWKQMARLDFRQRDRTSSYLCEPDSIIKLQNWFDC